MRPQVLNKLFRPTSALKGVGPRIAKLIARLAGLKVIDVLWHLPRELINRQVQPDAASAVAGEIATLTLKVIRHEPTRVKRQPYRVRCSDGLEEVTLIFFHAKEDYIRKILPDGSLRVVSGTIDRFRGDTQITHPDYVLAPEDAKTFPSSNRYTL